VCHANALARALLSSAPASITEQLAGLRGGSAPPPGIAVTHLDHPGHLLAVLQADLADAAARAAAAAVRWGLSDRQRQVLERLAEGWSNRAIADGLRCAPATVDVHVSAILERAGAESRAELVARLWTGT
jgi:DNA-binding NarL/FixJ family response regulator